ncbi:unnamed protein product [Mycena citricolor]|uniref:JmjC domain-containing protein n=1 Tax=Mycena citricolor TaxID=2018698 RepID=A0AAD2HJ61_9AGAR|nr:unnamed protein product [Mycena citricolor]
MATTSSVPRTGSLSHILNDSPPTPVQSHAISSRLPSHSPMTNESANRPDHRIGTDPWLSYARVGHTSPSGPSPRHISVHTSPQSIGSHAQYPAAIPSITRWRASDYNPDMHAREAALETTSAHIQKLAQMSNTPRPPHVSPYIHPLQTFSMPASPAVPRTPDLADYQMSERASTRLIGRPQVSYEETGNVNPSYPIQSTSHLPQKRGASDSSENDDRPPRFRRKLNSKQKETKAAGASNKRPGSSKRSAKVDSVAGDPPDMIYQLSPKLPIDRSDVSFTILPVRLSSEANLTREPQTSRCMSNRFKSKGFPHCVSCTRRWVGDTCRFQNLRSFFYTSTGELAGFCFYERRDQPAVQMEYPSNWNAPLTKTHFQLIKKTIATALLPILREELEHTQHSAVIYRPRENEVRATCDSCLTSIFACSWMCRLCGREACKECFERVKDLTVVEVNTEQDMADQRARKDKQAHCNPFFLTCHKRNDHGAKDFSPVTRFVKKELEQPFETWNFLRCRRTVLIKRFKDAELSEQTFALLWAQGEPVLVTDTGSKLKLDWDPQYFIENHGSEDCLLIDCQSDQSTRRTVKEFFSTFGKYEDRNQCWKLKDWPPSSDFKTSFPKLYEDFSQAVPIPNYVRRDGVLNIASHFPSNTVSPDLGPKMYNAYANLAEEGNKGSTRLHMDMADALNILTYAAPCPDGSPGYAAWDIFRAEDSFQIRQFLAEQHRQLGQDPIHSQQIYLEDDMRLRLWQERGVKSYRILQKTGEAVFIPAGCAHQVRNMSDCIKIAVDFVSLENVQRCATLTKEFRQVNTSKLWKEDVLQLRTMMWFAWLSCLMQENNSQS